MDNAFARIPRGLPRGMRARGFKSNFLRLAEIQQIKKIYMKKILNY
jgi:hypothetical protein